MYGMYDGLQGNSTYTQYYAARMFYYGDVRGDDMQARTQGMRTSSCYEMRYTADDAPNMWNIQYNVIRRANRLIEAVDNKTITDAENFQAELADIYNQAKVIRALVHFDLVKVYGMPYTYDEGTSLGVPFVDKPLDRDAQPGRDKVADVYAKVVADLNNAIDICCDMFGGLFQITDSGGVGEQFNYSIQCFVCHLALILFEAHTFENLRQCKFGEDDLFLIRCVIRDVDHGKT